MSEKPKKRRPIRKPKKPKPTPKLVAPEHKEAEHLGELIPPPKERKREHLRLIEHQAMIDYVSDPEQRGLRYHFNRPDRAYPKYASYDQVEKWSVRGKWGQRREEFWIQISDRILERHQEALVQVQQIEVEELTELRRQLLEHIRPLTEEDGSIKCYPPFDRYGEPHPLAGKPMLPHAISSYDKAVKVFLEVDERLMTKRGEVTKRRETIDSSADERGDVPALQPVVRTPKLSPEQARTISRLMLRQQQPELDKPLAIDVKVGAGNDADDET